MRKALIFFEIAGWSWLLVFPLWVGFGWTGLYIGLFFNGILTILPWVFLLANSVSIVPKALAWFAVLGQMFVVFTAVGVKLSDIPWLAKFLAISAGLGPTLVMVFFAMFSKSIGKNRYSQYCWCICGLIVLVYTTQFIPHVMTESISIFGFPLIFIAILSQIFLARTTRKLID